MPARRSENLRERILLELVRLIARHGLSGVAIQDVADASHTTKQVVLYHFSSRDALHASMVDWIVEDANRSLLGVLREGTTEGVQRVDALVARVRALVAEDPLSASVALRVLLDGEPPLRQRLVDGLRPWRQFVLDQLGQGVREGFVRSDADVEALVSVIASSVMSVVALLPLHDTDEEPEQWRARRTEQLFRSVRQMLQP